MVPNAPLYPDAASAIAREVDRLMLFELAGTVAFSLLIAILLLFFAVRYRRKHAAEVGVEPAHGPGTTLLEVTWSGIPLALMLFCFVWGTKLFFAQHRPPADALPFTVIGKQWMWKFQHPDGHREINELHVPLGKPIKLTMTSEDVIHDVFVPAFRIHVDVIPGRYTTYWFQADRIGTYHLFCGQYCGVEHSRMVGRVVVMPPADYEAWLAGTKKGPTAVASGQELFQAKACNTCHRPDSSARAPILNGLFGTKVALLDGASATADESYIRESILNPQAKIVAGFQPVMPTFKGTLSEEEILQLVSYVKSLPPAGAAEPAPAAASAATPTGSPAR